MMAHPFMIHLQKTETLNEVSLEGISFLWLSVLMEFVEAGQAPGATIFLSLLLQKYRRAGKDVKSKMSCLL